MSAAAYKRKLEDCTLTACINNAIYTSWISMAGSHIMFKAKSVGDGRERPNDLKVQPRNGDGDDVAGRVENA
jgi:hypothetical protein